MTDIMCEASPIYANIYESRRTGHQLVGNPKFSARQARYDRLIADREWKPVFVLRIRLKQSAAT
jgi:hypothetical protein